MERYTKLQKIGQGSFGCAYLAVKKSDPSARKYVIKEIRMDPRDQQTALGEAKLLAALDHPNIIACKESFLASANVLCIVTEFADGGDLRKQLNDRTAKRCPYKESDLLDLFIQSCLALKHLHDRKIIHRDIKPENIFLTTSHVVKLGDFGVATVLSHTLACAQTLTGTPYYTSPEICLGKKYNSKTDIWSLGCVLYELATFSHAFNGRSQRQLFENIISGAVAPIPSTSGYSARLVSLVSEMLQKNPRDRPSVNQIIRKPIIMDKIQSFLSQRAIADELNHTVLHGQHIFHRGVPAQQHAQKKNQEFASPVAQKRDDPVDRPPEVIRRAEAALVARKPVVVASAAVAKSPVDPRVRAAQYEPPRSNKKKQAEAVVSGGGAAAVGRRNFLKSSGSKKKLIKKVVASPSPRKYNQVKRNAMPSPQPLPPPPPVAVAQHAKRPGQPVVSEMQQRLLQRKKEVVARAREDAQMRKAANQRAAPAVPVGSPPAVRGAAPPPPPRAAKQPAPQAAKSKPKTAGSSPSPVANRISVFMAQWEAQREQILSNLGSPSPLPPPPPPTSSVPVNSPPQSSAPVSGRGLLPPPPPASAAAIVAATSAASPLTATGIVVKRGKKPTSAAAVAAAKQRDAMRRDIQERKKVAAQKNGKRPSIASSSPLDDPVILVQNLPDYKPSRAAQAQGIQGPAPARIQPAVLLVSPPQAPVALATPHSEQELEEADAEEGEEEVEEDVPTPDSTVAANANLEFQRMLLHLQSVVDDPMEADEDDEDDQQQQEQQEDEQGATMALDTTTPVEPRPFLSLPLSVLLDPKLQDALRSQLRVHNTTSPAQEEIPSETVMWLAQYIQGVI